jgi:N-acetylmuramoyl-L-alanine amidase
MKLISLLLILLLCTAIRADDPTTQPRDKWTLDRAMAVLDDRPAWGDFPDIATLVPRHPAEELLVGMTIVLDPGHGGDAHLPGYKRGPTGVREAEINLRVAKLLEKLLTDAGVNVILTRDVDRDLSLVDRAAVANRAEAELFISIHHNAVDRPQVNFTSIWLHGDLAEAGPELAAAGSVAKALERHLRTDVGYTARLMSDFQMFRSGFGVLRAAKVPAMLLESSFHSNPQEEQRLDDARHNLREAYAIYEGLCEWARGGVPTQTVMLSPQEDRVQLQVKLDTGLPAWWGDDLRGPVAPSISIEADGSRVWHTFDRGTRTASADLPADVTSVSISHFNTNGHRNWPRDYFVVLTDGDTHLVTERPTTRPTTQPMIDQPWLRVRQQDLPITLLDGGATAASQEVLDAIELPQGSALTIANVSPSGGVRAMRWRDSRNQGFYPASTVKLATALMTLRQVDELDGKVSFNHVNVSLDGSEPKPVKDLLRAMIADSDNDDFNTLQEVAGFAETAQYMEDVGCDTFIIRRHFTRPHWNHSRDAAFIVDGETIDVPARPGPDFALNRAGGESNWSNADDFVRLVAATFFTKVRELDGFDTLAEAMANNNDPFVGRGVDRLGGFRTSGKPGWWPGDGAFCDAAYVYDEQNDRHYLVGIYWQGEARDNDEVGQDELDRARTGIADAVEQTFRAIRDGRIRL